MLSKPYVSVSALWVIILLSLVEFIFQKTQEFNYKTYWYFLETKDD